MAKKVGKVYEGSCLCQQVQYRVTGPLGNMANCFCADCRKSHSAAFATFIGVPRERFVYRKGEEALHGYDVRPGIVRSEMSDSYKANGS